MTACDQHLPIIVLVRFDNARTMLIAHGVKFSIWKLVSRECLWVNDLENIDNFNAQPLYRYQILMFEKKKLLLNVKLLVYPSRLDFRTTIKKRISYCLMFLRQIFRSSEGKKKYGTDISVIFSVEFYTIPHCSFTTSYKSFLHLEMNQKGSLTVIFRFSGLEIVQFIVSTRLSCLLLVSICHLHSLVICVFVLNKR